MVEPILRAESHDYRIQNIHCQLLFNPQPFIPTKTVIIQNDSGHGVALLVKIQPGWSRVRLPKFSLEFFIDIALPAHFVPRVVSDSNR